MKRFVRKEILNFSPYIPGKPMEEVKREYRLKRIVKLASNENPLGPSKKSVESLMKFIEQINRYPDGSSFYLREILAKKLGVSSDMILISSGSDEAIELIGKTFLNKNDEIIVSEHSFIRFKMAGYLMGARVKIIPMKDYKHDIIKMVRSVTNRTKIIFIANPNNPTGTYNTKLEFDDYFSTINGKHIITVVDEAYHEYASLRRDYPDCLNYLKNGKNVIVLRTFSKIYGLAGLRVGYAIANKDIISFMDRIRPPFNVSSLAQIAAISALKDVNHVRNSQWSNEKEKEFLYAQLKRLGVEYIPSATNFVLISVKPYTGKKIFQKLLKKGVIVRAMDEYNLPYHIRVTIGRRSENRFFIRCLSEILKKQV